MESNINYLDPIHKKIKISDIDMSNRVRTTYDGIDELARNIKTNGLIHDLCVMGRKGFPDKPYVLLAGGRRLTAIKKLGWLSVSCKVFPELTPIQLKIVELAENLDREDLDAITVIKRRTHIFKMIQEEALNKGEKAPTLSEVSSRLGLTKGTLSRELQYGLYLEKFPDEASKMKSRKDIANAIRNLNEKAHIQELARRQKSTTKRKTSNTAESLVNSTKNSIKVEGKSTKELKKLKLDKGVSKSNTNIPEIEYEDEMAIQVEEDVQKLLKHFIVADAFKANEKYLETKLRFGLIEIDPPYSIDYTKVKRSKENTESYEEIPEDEYYLFMKKTLEDAYELLQDNGWCICWYAVNKYHDMILRLARSVGFTCFGIPAIWTKPNSTGQNNQPKINLSNTYETFFVLRKGKAFLNRYGQPNEFRVPNIKDKTHATEKPVELYQKIFDVLVSEGTSAYVMFAGSGSAIVAGLLNGLNIVGVDSSEAHKVSYEGLLRKFLDI